MSENGGAKFIYDFQPLRPEAGTPPAIVERIAVELAAAIKLPGR